MRGTLGARQCVSARRTREKRQRSSKLTGGTVSPRCKTLFSCGLTRVSGLRQGQLETMLAVILGDTTKRSCANPPRWNHDLANGFGEGSTNLRKEGAIRGWATTRTPREGSHRPNSEIQELRVFSGDAGGQEACSRKNSRNTKKCTIAYLPPEPIQFRAGGRFEDDGLWNIFMRKRPTRENGTAPLRG